MDSIKECKKKKHETDSMDGIEEKSRELAQPSGTDCT